MSRIGKKAINIPKDVRIESKDGMIQVKGPKGELSRSLSDRISIDIKDNKLFVNRASDAKLDKALHGLFRALINNMIIGVNQGFEKELEIIGVGFKAQAQGDNLNMQLGFSHPVNMPIPKGLKIETPKHTQIKVSGVDKELVGRIASEIRKICPPEPYKGKGIRFAGERIKKKVGKAQATTK
ncbi:MAG: 50S ribosomal protein L6 [Candidatus Omnitrophota bacterium]